MILLLPSTNIEEAIAILSERARPEHREREARVNWTFLKCPSNGRLATHTVVTGRRPLDEVCEEVLALVT